MTQAEFVARSQELADRVDAGDLAGGLAVAEELVASDLPDLDKVIVCVNGATVCEKMGRDAEALGWLERAIELERPLLRFFAAEHYAASLAGRDRNADSLAIYRRLVFQPYLTQRDRERMQANVRELEQRLRRGS